MKIKIGKTGFMRNEGLIKSNMNFILKLLSSQRLNSRKGKIQNMQTLK